MFGSMMNDINDIVGGHMRQMNNMMNSMFFGYEGMLGGSPFLGSPSNALMPFGNGPSSMMPFGFPNMNQMMQNVGRLPNNMNGGHSYSSSTVMTMSSGPDGKPQIYRESSSTRSAPGGIREVKKSVCDSRTGVKKMAIGHHIGERAHVKEREQNYFSGQIEENDEFINLDEEEAEEFNNEWEQKTRRSYHGNHGVSIRAIDDGASSSDNRPQKKMLALPPATGCEISRRPTSYYHRSYNNRPQITSYAPRNDNASTNMKEQSQKRKQNRPTPYRRTPRNK